MNRFSGSESREIRGRMVRALQINHPYEIGDQLLEEILTKARYKVTLQSVQGHLLYLKDKGYITVEEVSFAGIRRQVAKLTPKGLDLIEGNIEADVGIRWLV